MKRLVAVVVLAVITLTSAPALADAGTLISCLPQFSAYTPAFITSPTSDSVVNSTQLISLAGYAPAAGTTVNILARNWTSPPSFSQDQIGSFTVPSTNPVSTPSGTLYYWLFVEMGGGGSDRGRVARSLLARTLARSPPPRDRSLRVPKAATVPRPVVWEENRGGEAGVG